MLHAYHAKCRDLLKPFKERQHNDKYKANISSGKTTLFDIAMCKCNLTALTGSSACTCAKGRQIPVEERTFLEDRRTSRKMIFSNIDTKRTRAFKQKSEKLQQRAQRKAKEANRNNKRGEKANTDIKSLDYTSDPV